MCERAVDEAAACAQALFKIRRQEESFPKQLPAEICNLGERNS
jgi:hypothetical protein